MPINPYGSDQSRLARNGFERGGLNIAQLQGKRACFAIADMFAHHFHSILITAPLKDLDGQQEKVFKTDADGGYDGEWSKIKDIVRTTILAGDADAFVKVSGGFRQLQNKAALQTEIRRLFSQGFFQQLYRDLSAEEKAMIANGDWEIMPGAFKEKNGVKDGYTDASVVLQCNTRNSVGGANQPKTPTRAAVGPSQALWVQTVRVEIQINTPNMIYGKQFASDFLKMIPPPHGGKLFEEVKQRSSIFAGLGHMFYEVSRAGVLVSDTQAISKRYYEYLRNPSPGSPAFVTLCRDLAAYCENHKTTIKGIVHAGNHSKLPGEGVGVSMVQAIGLNHPSLNMPQNSPGAPQKKGWAVPPSRGFRSTG